MKITDLRIGDRVQNKTSKFPMTVVDIISEFSLPINPNKGRVYLDFEGNEGDVWEENVEDLEFCEPRYKLLKWEKFCENTLETYISLGVLSISYDIDDCENSYHLYTFVDRSEDSSFKKIGEYQTLENAKAAAEKHYNELASEIIEKLTSSVL